MAECGYRVLAADPDPQGALTEMCLGLDHLQTCPGCIAVIHPQTPLMQMAREARKPIFQLKPGDGALGSHTMAALDAWAEFRQLATKIIDQVANPD